MMCFCFLSACTIPEDERISPVSQEVISSRNFDLVFTVPEPAICGLSYGADPDANEFRIRSDSAKTEHRFTLKNLEKGESYYVYPIIFGRFNRAVGRGISRKFSTDSERKEAVTACFNRPFEGNAADLDVGAAFIGRSFQDTILHYINSANLTLDIAMFCAEDDTISVALNQAEQRGVIVRYIMSGDDQDNSTLDTLSEKIQQLAGDPKQSMHNKFMIVDADHPDATTLISSANNAYWDFITQTNNMLIIRDQEVAKCFLTEFDEMWSGKFGYNKSDNTRKLFEVNGIQIEIYFHPTDSLNRKVAALISEADRETVFAQMHFWGKQIALSLIEAKSKGVKITGVMKSNMAKYSTSEFHFLSNQGIDIRVDTLKRGLHHKFTVVDAGDADAFVITGTYNWHYGSMTFDDCMVVVRDSLIALQYRQEFAQRYKQAVKINSNNQ